MDENKEESGFASKVDKINLGPYRHVIHFQETGGERQWMQTESDFYLPQEILDQARGCQDRYVNYFDKMFAEFGVKLQYFTRHDGMKIAYIRQTHRRWTVFVDWHSAFGYYKRRIKKPAVDEQKEMWDTFEQTEAPQEP